MDKKLKNELFRVAVDYLFREKKVGSQKELAEKIGITEPSLSRVMNGGRTVSDKTIHKMNEAFGGIFNMAYFRGEDPQCLLMEDLRYYKQHPEERMVFDKQQETASPAPTAIDYTFLIEKAVEKATDYADKTIAVLEKQVADKDREIVTLNARIRELETIIKIQTTDNPLGKYPFPVGVADDGSIHIITEK
jgi:transcriptional regulator with XRE-family HTH domain